MAKGRAHLPASVVFFAMICGLAVFGPLGLVAGPLILAFSKEDPGAAARVVKEFAKGNDKLVPTLVSLGGQVYPAADIDRVASLPTKAQALSMLLGVMKAPVTKFVRTLAEPAAKLVRTIDAIKATKAA